MPLPPRPPARGNYVAAAAIFGFVGAAFTYSAGFAVKQEDISKADLEDYRVRNAEKQELYAKLNPKA